MVKQNLLDVFIKDVFWKPAKKSMSLIKTIFKHSFNNWRLDLLYLIDYGMKSYKGLGSIFFVMDSFSINGFDVPLKNKAAQTITVEFPNHISEHKSSVIENDDGKEFGNKIFTEIQNNNLIKKLTDTQTKTSFC